MGRLMPRFRGDLPRVVQTARAEIGYVAARGNRNKYGRWFGWDGVPWCVIFASWVFDRAGNRLPPLSNRMGAAYVPTVKSHAQKHGQWRGRSYNPRPGDLIVFWFTTRPDHLGIVGEQGRLRDGRVHTYEGNTGADPRNGGRVLERFRSGGIHGFVVVDHVGASRPANPQPQPVPPPEPDPEEDEDMAVVIRHHDSKTRLHRGSIYSDLTSGPTHQANLDRIRYWTFLSGRAALDLSKDAAASQRWLDAGIEVALLKGTAMNAQAAANK